MIIRDLKKKALLRKGLGRSASAWQHCKMDSECIQLRRMAIHLRAMIFDGVLCICIGSWQYGRFILRESKTERWALLFMPNLNNVEGRKMTIHEWSSNDFQSKRRSEMKVSQWRSPLSFDKINRRGALFFYSKECIIRQQMLVHA